MEARDQQIVRLYGEGVPMTALATRFGITRQRVHQIVRRRAGVVEETAIAARRQPRDEPEHRR
ncbi:MAG: helix-turn-helix domain-containing protein [Nocardioidaceae bacterium]|nr:helix-turn-helix domain-containing protein [Nocardioidaceae bacterium]